MQFIVFEYINRLNQANSNVGSNLHHHPHLFADCGVRRVLGRHHARLGHRARALQRQRCHLFIDGRCSRLQVVADGTRGQGLTLVPISAELELTLPLSAELKLTLSPTQAKLTRGCDLKVLKLSYNVSDVSRRSSS